MKHPLELHAQPRLKARKKQTKNKNPKKLKINKKKKDKHTNPQAATYADSPTCPWADFELSVKLHLNWY